MTSDLTNTTNQIDNFSVDFLTCGPRLHGGLIVTGDLASWMAVALRFAPFARREYLRAPSPPMSTTSESLSEIFQMSTSKEFVFLRMRAGAVALSSNARVLELMAKAASHRGADRLLRWVERSVSARLHLGCRSSMVICQP